MTPVDDFGVSGGALLTRVHGPKRPRGHSTFWTAWKQRLADAACEIRPVRAMDRDASDPSATHVLEGVGHTRIGCVLLEPPAGVRVRGGMVTTHGYAEPMPLADEARRWKRVTERGTAVLVLRVRGYAGSRLDVGDLSSDGQWILQGLGGFPEPASSKTDWIVSAAVGDLVLAVRGLRGWLSSRGGGGVALHGESFGGGLAVIAASQLSDTEPIDRLCVGLPTFGDWAWRSEHPHGGSGEVVRRFVDRAGERGPEVAMLLGAFDAALHARRVSCPVLMKLALGDEVVPAPTQHSVFNSLRAPAVERWRFLVACGHADAGIADARRHAMFERASVDFLDFAASPMRSMVAWEGVMSGGERVDREPDGGLFGEDAGRLSDHDAMLIEAYVEAGRTLDDLPYTGEFDRVLAAVRERAPAFGAREIFHRLQNLRKAGKLPRAGVSPEKPATIDREEESLLAALVVERVGTMGQRDQLPYAREFDGLVSAFNQRTGHDLSPHSVWRLVAKLAK